MDAEEEYSELDETHFDVGAFSGSNVKMRIILMELLDAWKLLTEEFRC